MRHRVMGTLSACVLALALAGCGDDPEPNIADPTSEAPTSPSISEPVTEPPTSSTPPEPESETAQEFIRRWAEVEQKMQNSGDTAAYRALSDNCIGCDSLAATVEQYYGAGGSITWGGWRITRIRRFDPSQIEYQVSVDSAPTRYREVSGGPLKRLTGGPAEWVIELRKEGQSWVVTDKDELIG